MDQVKFEGFFSWAQTCQNRINGNGNGIRVLNTQFVYKIIKALEQEGSAQQAVVAQIQVVKKMLARPEPKLAVFFFLG